MKIVHMNTIKNKLHNEEKNDTERSNIEMITNDRHNFETNQEIIGHKNIF